MPITELTEDTVNDFIKDGKAIIKGWDENCGPCTMYKPVFDKFAAANPDLKIGFLRIDRNSESSFRSAYMPKDDKGQPKSNVPLTAIFENGKFKDVVFGSMRESELKDFIDNGTQPVRQTQKPLTAEEFAKKASIIELKAAVYDEATKIEQIQTTIKLFNDEIQLRQKPN